MNPATSKTRPCLWGNVWVLWGWREMVATTNKNLTRRVPRVCHPLACWEPSLRCLFFYSIFMKGKTERLYWNQPAETEGAMPKIKWSKKRICRRAREWAALFAGPTKTNIITAKVFDSPKNPKPIASYLILQWTSNPLLLKASVSMQLLESP